MGKDLYFSSIVTKSLDPINSEERFFEGYLTVEVKDKQGEITVVDELYKVLPVWMDRGAPISDTHSNRIIGKGINFARTTYKSGDEEIPAIKITGKIHKNYELDNEIWSKIKSGEYKGLSFGGATKANRTPKVMKDGSVAYQLTDLEHYEVAVCKDPAVPLALITDFNPVAKAMANNTEDRDGKMVIKCSKFGCRIDLNKITPVEAGGIIGDGKCVNCGRDHKKITDEMDKKRIQQGGGSMTRMHVADCPTCGRNIAQGKRGVSFHGRTGKRIRDTGAADYDPKVHASNKAEKKEPKLTEGGKKVLQEATTVADLYKVDLSGIATFEGKVEALIDEGKSRESAEKIVGSFTKKGAYCANCGEIPDGQTKLYEANSIREGKACVSCGQHTPKPKQGEQAERNRKFLETKKDAPTGHDPTQVAHSPDTPREMELEKGKDHSNTGGDTSGMYNQNGAEQRVNSKKAECPHCGKHFKHEETPHTDVPYDKYKDPDHVLTLNEKELEEYEKKKGAVGGEVPPQWTGSGSPYPKGERKVIKRKKVIKTSSWKDLKNKAFELDMQWRVIDLVKDSMDGKGDNKPKKGDAPQSHADQSEDIKNLGYELDGSHEEGETIGIGRDWDGTAGGLFYKQPKQGKAPIKGKKKEGFTYERDHDPENHVGRETKDHARTGSAQQAQYDGTEGKSQSKEKPLKELTGGELEEVEKLKSLTMELKDALRDEAVPEQLARPRKPKRFEGNLSKEPSDSQQQAEDARRYSERGGREGRKPFKSTKWRDHNPRTGGEGGRTDRSGKEGLLQPTRRGEKVHTHEGKERGGKSKKIGRYELGDIITNPYNRRYVSTERQPTGRRRSEANERDRKAREAKRNEEARLSIKALSKKLIEELKGGSTTANANAANGTSPRGGDFSGTTDDGKFNVRHNGGRKTNIHGRRAEDLGNFP